MMDMDEDDGNGEHLVVDAADLQTARVARFASHSCGPNAEFVAGVVEGMSAVLLCSKVEPSEATVDYGWRRSELSRGAKPTVCKCLSDKCRHIIEK